MRIDNEISDALAWASDVQQILRLCEKWAAFDDEDGDGRCCDPKKQDDLPPARESGD
ncbi:MAG: hypothetical protein ACYTHJ_18140 [Planctomycetota bacterium]